MKLRKFAVASAVLGMAMTGLVASTANADPSGCGMYNQLTGSSAMTSKTTGNCASSATRKVYAEIKQQKPFATDPLVTSVSGTSTGTTHVKSVTSCDDGETHKYYGRGYYSTTTSDHHDSPVKEIRSC